MATRSESIIETGQKLAKTLDSMGGFIGVDTEFVRERTYYPELCLLQIADWETAACVDCRSGIDLAEHSRELMERPGVIMHSARQDLEIFWYVLQQLPATLIDTQVAAGLLGMPPQIGYGELVNEQLGKMLDKTNSRRDWTKRPLPEDALRYALDDVVYLLPLWDTLANALDKAGRMSWFEEDCQRLLDPAVFDAPKLLFGRLKGAARLNDKQRQRAFQLLQWREAHARAINRPRRWVLSDRALLNVAAENPQTPEALSAIPEIGSRLVRRAGRDMLRALETDTSIDVPPATPPLDAGQRRLQKEYAAEVAETAQALGISNEVLATRAEVETIVRGETPPRLANGWRRPLLQAAGVVG